MCCGTQTTRTKHPIGCVSKCYVCIVWNCKLFLHIKVFTQLWFDNIVQRVRVNYYMNYIWEFIRIY